VATTITSLETMRDYIVKMLGGPVINVELDNTQLDQIIFDSVEDFNRYNYSEGSHKDYIIITLSAGQDEYSLSGQHVQDTCDLQLSLGVDGINTLFSPTHELLYQDWVVKGNYPGGGGGPGMVMADYDISMMYLEEIKRHFSKEYTCYFRSGSETLKITPTPKTSLTGAVFVYKKETAANLYNNQLVKRLCVARAKKLWGEILSKYSAQLPGGGTYNGEAIYQRGATEETEVMIRIQQESPPIDFQVG